MWGSYGNYEWTVLITVICGNYTFNYDNHLIEKFSERSIDSTWSINESKNDKFPNFFSNSINHNKKDESFSRYFAFGRWPKLCNGFTYIAICLY